MDTMENNQSVHRVPLHEAVNFLREHKIVLDINEARSPAEFVTELVVYCAALEDASTS